MTLAARKIRLILMLRQAGVTDTDVLSAMELVPRDLFVPEVFRDKAYENLALPIGCGQTISQPTVVGVMTQALNVEPRCRLLEIGTGSGYHTAVLARLCRRVYTIEQHQALLGEAQARLEALGLLNVTARHGDGTGGWPLVAPVDRIVVCAGTPEVPAALADQLVEGGILVVPVGSGQADQRLVRVTRGEKGFSTEKLARAYFVPMQSGDAAEFSENMEGVIDTSR